MLVRSMLFVLAVGMITFVTGCNETTVATTPIIPPTATAMPVPTPTVTQTALEEVAKILSHLADANMVTIKDDWGGFSPVSPLIAHISIVRTAGVYTGSGQFAAGPGPLASRVEDYTFGDTTVEDFLTRLSGSPVEVKPYVPDVPWSDDYPSISIEVQLVDESVIFHTKSQGAQHIPWAIDINGDTYTIDSSQPNYALQKFEQAIHVNEVMDDLIKQITGTR